MKVKEGMFSADEIAAAHEAMMKRSLLFKEYGMDQEEMRRRIVVAMGGSGPVLEIGTGRGHLTVLLARIFDTVVTVDIDGEGQRTAMRNAAYYRVTGNIDFITADGSHLEYSDGSFDAVVSSFTFHHLERPFTVLDEMARLAKRRIVLSDFNGKGLDVLDRVHAREGGTHGRGTTDFSESGAYLEKAGFTVRTVEDDMQTLHIALRRDT